MAVRLPEQFQREVAAILNKLDNMEMPTKYELLHVAIASSVAREQQPGEQPADEPLQAEIAALRAQLCAIVATTPVGERDGRAGRGKPQHRFATAAEQRAYDLGYATGWHRGRRESKNQQYAGAHHDAGDGAGAGAGETGGAG